MLRRTSWALLLHTFGIDRLAFDAVGREELMAVACCSVGDVEPVAVIFVDELVVGKVEANEEVTQTAVVLREVGDSADVGSLTEEML